MLISEPVLPKALGTTTKKDDYFNTNFKGYFLVLYYQLECRYTISPCLAFPMYLNIMLDIN